MTVCHPGPLWRVVCTAPRAEAAVAGTIGDELGFETYLPREKLFVVRRGAKIVDARPLFPRYLFALVDPHRQEWQALRDIDGVSDVLMASHDVPGYVPSAYIEALRKAEAVGIFDRTTRLPNNFEVGETVRVSDGVFAGHNALITEFMAKMRSATAKKRAKLLVQFMGQMVKLDLPVTSLEKL